MTTYPKLQPELKAQLKAIAPSRDGSVHYYPCAVTLRNGSVLDRVYVVRYKEYVKTWGITPEADPGKKWVGIDQLVAIRESSYRLPPSLANKIYKAGESGMGYCVFTVEFVNGVHQAYLTGNAVDFIVAPTGMTAADAREVMPHAGRENYIEAPDYWWCIHS